MQSSGGGHEKRVTVLIKWLGFIMHKVTAETESSDWTRRTDRNKHTTGTGLRNMQQWLKCKSTFPKQHKNIEPYHVMIFTVPYL